MNIFEQHKKLGWIKRDHELIERITQEHKQKEELKNLFILCITGSYEIKKYLEQDIYFENSVINELKMANTYFKKASDEMIKNDSSIKNVNDEDVKKAKESLLKIYESGNEKEYKKMDFSNRIEERKISMINLIGLKLEEYIKSEYVSKNVKTNIKYCKTYIEKFINLLVEVAG